MGKKSSRSILKKSEKSTTEVILKSLLIISLIVNLVFATQSIFGRESSGEAETEMQEIALASREFFVEFEDKNLHMMNAADLLAMHEEGRVLILDVRSHAERREGSITDSGHIPLIMLADRTNLLPPDAVFAVYGENDIASAYGVFLLNVLGYEAYVLEGGMEAWEKAGGKLNTCYT